MKDQLEAPARLVAHLTEWLGAWPPVQPLHVVRSRQRLRPGWDGHLHPGIGVSAPTVGAVLSVPPSATAALAEVDRLWEASGGSYAALFAVLPDLVGFPERGTYEAVFRWTTDPAPLRDVGRWLPADHDEVPPWLRPFGGEVLVADDVHGRHLAGVGIKRHDSHGRELSVVTTPAARGRGLARALVAQAARRVLDEGAVPTYLHGLTNTASARVADAAGFPDQGWRSFGLSEAAPAQAHTTVHTQTGQRPDTQTLDERSR